MSSFPSGYAIWEWSCLKPFKNCIKTVQRNKIFLIGSIFHPSPPLIKLTTHFWSSIDILPKVNSWNHHVSGNKKCSKQRFTHSFVPFPKTAKRWIISVPQPEEGELCNAKSMKKLQKTTINFSFLLRLFSTKRKKIRPLFARIYVHTYICM